MRNYRGFYDQMLHRLPATATCYEEGGNVHPFLIRHLISKYTRNVGSLCDLLYHTGSAITGSLVLQSVIQSDYGSTDMDLCVPLEHVKTLKEFFVNEGYSEINRYAGDNTQYKRATIRALCSNPNAEFSMVRRQIGDMGGDADYEFLDEKVIVKLYNANTGLSIDIISSGAQFKSFVEMMVLAFDLSCCMNFFNGRHIFSYYHALTMSDICLLTRTSRIDCTERNRLRDEARITKYSERGFTIVYDHSNIPPSLVHESKYLDVVPNTVSLTPMAPMHTYAPLLAHGDLESKEMLSSLLHDASKGFFRNKISENETAGMYREETWTPLNRAVFTQVLINPIYVLLPTNGARSKPLFITHDVNDSRVCFEFHPHQQPEENVRRNTQLSLMRILEDIGLPARGLRSRNNNFCVRLSCEIVKRHYHEELIELSHAPAGMYADSPLYSKGGAAYREAMQRLNSA
jgi:hypothetical protein